MGHERIRNFQFYEIHGKERPRQTKGSNKPYTPNNTVRYEKMIRRAYLNSHQEEPIIQGAVMMQIIVKRRRPKRHFKTSKGVLTRKHSKHATKYPLKTPDLSNIAKAIEDALNGVAYQDDKQICNLQIVDEWNDDDRREVVHVSILALEGK